jgi:hypothetical protein
LSGSAARGGLPPTPSSTRRPPRCATGKAIDRRQGCPPGRPGSRVRCPKRSSPRTAPEDDPRHIEESPYG